MFTTQQVHLNRMNNDKSKRMLFACMTDYALINSINFIFSNIINKSNLDLYLICREDKMERRAQIIRNKCNIFSNIICYQNLNKLNIIKKILIILFPKIFLRKYSGTDSNYNIADNNYDILICQSLFYATIFSRLHTINNIYLIEEGISTYTGRTINFDKRSLYFKIAMYFSLLPQINGEIVHQPNLFIDKKNMNLYKINYMTYDCIQILYKIFEYNHNDLYSKYKFVYLGTSLVELYDLLSDKAKLSRYEFVQHCICTLKALFTYCGSNKIIYRKHPTENEDDIKKYIESDIFIEPGVNVWEIETLENINDNHVLFSFFSTACYTPKILFNKEPYIVFLYKLLNCEFYQSNEMVDKIKKIYKKPQKIIVVDDIKELHVIISTILRQ